MEIDRAVKGCFIALVIAFFIIPMLPLTAGAFNGVPAFNPEARPGELSGNVYYDLDYDGTYQATEPDIAYQTIAIYDMGGTLISLTQSGEDGRYAFTELPAGQYIVHQFMNESYDMTTPDSVLISVGSGENVRVNFGCIFVLPRPWRNV